MQMVLIIVMMMLKKMVMIMTISFVLIKAIIQFSLQ